jgi:CRP/FNR family transcriptional regulator
MFNPSLTQAAAPAMNGFLAARAVPKAGLAVHERASQKLVETQQLLKERLNPQRRVVHAGDLIYQAGEQFGNLYILNSGFFKIVNLSADGREQVVGLKFRGDWLGFDGIAANH